MIDELEQWLELVTTAEKANLFLSILENLSDIGENGAYDEFSLLWQDTDNLYTGKMIDDLENVLYKHSKSVINGHGILLVDDFRLKDMNCIIETLVWLNYVTDKSEIKEIMEEDIDDKEKFVKLINLVNSNFPEYYLDNIIEVNQMLINQITKDSEDLPLEAVEDEDVGIGTIRRFDLIYNNRLCKQAIYDGLPVGKVNIDALLKHYRRNILNFYPLSPSDVAIELVGLYLISNEERKGISARTIKKAESIFSDISFLQKLRLEIPIVYGKVGING